MEGVRKYKNKQEDENRNVPCTCRQILQKISLHLDKWNVRLMHNHRLACTRKHTPL